MPISKRAQCLYAVHHGIVWKKGMALNQQRACCLVHMVHWERQEKSKCYAHRERTMYMNKLCVSLRSGVHMCASMNVRMCVWTFYASWTQIKLPPLRVRAVAVVSSSTAKSTTGYMALKESISDRLQHGVHTLYTLSMKQGGDECLRRLPPAAWWSILMRCSVTPGCT